MSEKMTIALITSGLALFGIIFKVVFPYIKEYRDKKRQDNLKKLAISSRENEETQYENIIDIARTYNFNYSWLVRWHNGGGKPHELANKKITINKEFTLESNLRQIKHLWQERVIDFEFSKTVTNLMMDEFIHIKDLELYPDNEGIRKLLNYGYGKEVILVELGYIENDYYFMIFQRDLIIKESRKYPIYLGVRAIENIKYRCSVIWKLAKIARRYA